MIVHPKGSIIHSLTSDNNKLSKLLLSVVCVLFFSITDSSSGVVFKTGEEKWLSANLALRMSQTFTQKGAPDGNSTGSDFVVQNADLYLNGQIHKNIKLTYNTEINSNTNTVEVLDAIARFELSGQFNIWTGRLLVPTDRALLAGPFYQTTFDFPFVRKYPAIFLGRDDGMVLWGHSGSGNMKYYIGMFDGQRDGPNNTDSPLFAGRLVFNFWDTETAYYNSNSYYGKKDIFSIGIGGASQKNGAGADVATQGDFTGWNIDLLLDKKLQSNSVLTVEMAVYNYDIGGAKLETELIDGKGYIFLLGYTPASKFGGGMIQPHLRYQKLDYKYSDSISKYEVGCHYLVDKHNSRITMTFGNTKNEIIDTVDKSVKLGVQLKI